MDTSTVLGIAARPFLLLVFLCVVWWIKKAIWHLLPPGRFRSALYKQRRLLR